MLFFSFKILQSKTFDRWAFSSLVIGGPPSVRGSVIGKINDVEFGIAFLNATITDSLDLDSRKIQAKITNIPQSLGKPISFAIFADFF